MNPLLIFKAIGISVGLSGGITGSIFSSFQAFTRITIEDLLKDDLLVDNDNSTDSIWKILKGKLDKSENQNEKILKETKLEDAKKPKVGTEATGNENGEKLKSWCQEIKNTKVKKFLPSNYETVLLNYVKDFCVITIGEKITSSKQFTSWDDDKSTLKANAGKLNSHSDGTNGKLSDEKELEDSKSKENEDEKGKALLNWCQKTYKKSYKGKSDNLWKLADHYCKKTQ